MRVSEQRHRMPDFTCSCGELLTAASGVDTDDMPKPGSLSICFKCGYLRIYTDELSLRELTEEEVSDVMRDYDLAQMVLTMRRAVNETR